MIVNLYLSTKYRISIYEWCGDPSKVMKCNKHYYLNHLTNVQNTVVSRVQDFIDMRDHSNYEHTNETELEHLLLSYAVNN